MERYIVSMTGRKTSIIKIPILPKLICRFNTIPIKSFWGKKKLIRGFKNSYEKAKGLGTKQF